MLEIEDIITTCPKGRLYESNNWKKMHHIPIKSKTINGYEIKIIKLNEYCSPRSKKKKKKFRLKHCFTPNWEDILALNMKEDI